MNRLKGGAVISHFLISSWGLYGHLDKHFLQIFLQLCVAVLFRYTIKSDVY